MSALGVFLERLELDTKIDVHCRLKKPYKIVQNSQNLGVVRFHIVLSGECFLSRETGEQRRLREGDFSLLFHGDAHVIWDTDEHPDYQQISDLPNGEGQGCVLETASPTVTMLCGYFVSSNPVSASLLRLLPDILTISLADVDELYPLVHLIREQAQHEDFGSDVIIYHLCYTLLALALRRLTLKDSEVLQTGLLALFADAKMSRALSVMIDDPLTSRTLDELAVYACLSRASFAKHFKQTTGIGAQSFARKLKMIAAASLLKKQRLCVANVADKIGYQSEAAFALEFKKHYGCSPAQYREQAQPSFLLCENLTVGSWMI